jgi:hypothetical protein
MKQNLPILFITMLAAFSSNTFGDSQEALTQAVVSYEITLPRVDTYEAALGLHWPTIPSCGALVGIQRLA